MMGPNVLALAPSRLAILSRWKFVLSGGLPGPGRTGRPPRNAGRRPAWSNFFRVLILEGNLITRRRLEEAGCQVQTYRGNEVSLTAG